MKKDELIAQILPLVIEAQKAEQLQIYTTVMGKYQFDVVKNEIYDGCSVVRYGFSQVDECGWFVSTVLTGSFAHLALPKLRSLKVSDLKDLLRVKYPNWSLLSLIGLDDFGTANVRYYEAQVQADIEWQKELDRKSAKARKLREQAAALTKEADSLDGCKTEIKVT